MSNGNEEVRPVMSEREQEIIQSSVNLFNNTPPSGNHFSDNLRRRTLTNLLNSKRIEIVIVYCLTGYASYYSTFKGESDANHWFAWTAKDRDITWQSYLIIEERKNASWILKHMIPIKMIESIKWELGPSDLTKFNIFLTVPGVEKIQTPDSIPFKVYRK